MLQFSGQQAVIPKKNKKVSLASLQLHVPPQPRMLSKFLNRNLSQRTNTSKALLPLQDIVLLGSSLFFMWDCVKPPPWELFLFCFFSHSYFFFFWMSLISGSATEEAQGQR